MPFKIKCKICGAEYSKKGIATHIWRSHGEGQKHNPNIGYQTKNRKVWNKGLTKETDKRVNDYAETFKKRIKSGEIQPSFMGKNHSDETKRKIGEKLSVNNKGGRSKWYSYKKTNGEIVKLQGTWEVRFAKIMDIIDENWIKPTLNCKQHSLQWKSENNVTHTYTPDFYSPKYNKYYEVKGYWWGNDKNKMKIVINQNPHICIEIIQKKELELLEHLTDTEKAAGSIPAGNTMRL